MLKNFEPNKVFSLTSKAPKYILLIFIIVISIGLLEALIFSPEDYIQSHSVRIMYVHVPSAWISLGTFSVIAILSFVIIIFKNKSFILIAKSLAPSGLVFNIIALVTGSIWGKPTWGTWWAWDARLTSMLILFFLYVAYIMTWQSIVNKELAAKISAALGVIGFINIPIIKFSVDWWNTLHQPATISKLSAPSIHISMLTPLLIMTFAYILFLATLFLIRLKIEIIEQKILRANK